MFPIMRSAGMFLTIYLLIKMNAKNNIIFHGVQVRCLLLFPGNKPQMRNIADVVEWSRALDIMLSEFIYCFI